jgi:phosphoenolpyruvate carboxykinase (ATP)
VFGVQIPTSCPNVDSNILVPKNTWGDETAYEAQAKKLGKLFNENFEKYKKESSDAIINAGPKV